MEGGTRESAYVTRATRGGSQGTAVHTNVRFPVVCARFCITSTYVAAALFYLTAFYLLYLISDKIEPVPPVLL